MDVSIDATVKELKEIDFLENLDANYSLIINDLGLRIDDLESEMVDKTNVSKENKNVFIKLNNDLLSQLINFMNLYKIIINEYGEIKYLEPEKELKYEKIQNSFDRIKDIYKELSEMNNLFIEKLNSCDEKICQVSNTLNSSVKNVIKVSGIENDMNIYSKSLLQFCEKRLNETVEECQLNKVFYFTNYLKTLKMNLEQLDEIFLSLSRDYLLLHPKTKNREHILCN